MGEKFVQSQVLWSFLEFEPYVLIGTFFFSAWLFYKFFLGRVSDERHRNLRGHHRNLAKHFIGMSVFFIAALMAREAGGSLAAASKAAPYLGLICFFWGLFVFVKISRLWVLQYLFLQSMREGVPLLIVNVATLLLSIALAFWSFSSLFGVQLAPLLATSAAFSIILGLAMQDTLGNLFAGLSLQIDRNFEIGDWLEVTSGIQKITGQVKEISWRSVLLVGFSDELITLPNRFVAQAQIANFSPPDQPIVRSQLFRLPYTERVDEAKKLLERGAAEISDVRGLPAPFAYVQDSTDSWLTVKLIYFIDSYGAQFAIGDKVMRKGIEILAENGIELARNELIVHRAGESRVET